MSELWVEKCATFEVIPNLARRDFFAGFLPLHSSHLATATDLDQLTLGVGSSTQHTTQPRSDEVNMKFLLRIIGLLLMLLAFDAASCEYRERATP